MEVIHLEASSGARMFSAKRDGPSRLNTRRQE